MRPSTRTPLRLLVGSGILGAEVGFAPTLEYAEVHETDPNRTCTPRQTAEVILINEELGY